MILIFLILDIEKVDICLIFRLLYSSVFVIFLKVFFVVLETELRPMGVQGRHSTFSSFILFVQKYWEKGKIKDLEEVRLNAHLIRESLNQRPSFLFLLKIY